MNKIYMDNEKEFYDLSEIIPEMIKEENVSHDFCIDYFMRNLKCKRCAIFTPETSSKEIVDWVLKRDKK